MEEVELYDVIKILHIASVISWFAGLLYLPRIFVYHTKVAYKSEADGLFQIMERKLLHFIMTPAMLMTFAFGIYLSLQIGFEFAWLHIKITLATLLIFYQIFLEKCRKEFAQGKNIRSEKFYRIINEVPAVFMLIIVSLVILKPFS